MAKYCAYCEEEKVTGDCNKTIMQLDLKLNGLPMASNEVFIDENCNMIMFLNSYRSGVCYNYKKRKIKYCPMCGRKLHD